MIRAFRHEVKGHGTRHSTDVDCLYFHFLDTGGSQVLQLSTLGSDQRQSQPKVSQTFQIGAEGAAELRQILDRTFPGIRPGPGEEPAEPPRGASPTPSVVEPEDPIDRFIDRAGLDKVDDLSTEGSRAQRRVVARDDRPYAGGDWYIVDFTNLQALRYADVELDLRSAPPAYQRAAVIVNDVSEDLQEFLVRAHADVIRLADLGLTTRHRRGLVSEAVVGTSHVSSRELVAPPQIPATFHGTEQLLRSEVYLAQKARAGRATVDDAVVRDVVNALVRTGWSGSIATVERDAGLAPGALRPMLPLMRRLLNVDGYETLALRDGGVLAIDENLLRQQFGLVSPAQPEGDRL
ncbi:hypothetical protein J1G44_06165 [Cellulomonas sp. zg-ZUI199]|uniref:Alkaline phosphatase-like protein PglZ C-terminal domain-containing protein n=1 Tax=Cellulomonas wangleii TaxID=2816956 RepID=A0ABX8D4W6_9CELL|nr:hypothetical protein [Cellulomonas wangleii]MBO0923781.1 hypothetical protein [Cellulomonas wangleii]MBO0924063.1 hypothetical protein [Cellulomonas wangleii]QVI62088.1 hypothetical protein KG103_17010 [Cellulomonas wangleii]